MGLRGTGLEINPFLVWFSSVKFRQFSPATIEKTTSLGAVISVASSSDSAPAVDPPPIHNIERWWNVGELNYLCRLKACIIETSDEGSDERDLLLVAFCRVVITLSNAEFNHQSMSFKDVDMPIPLLRLPNYASRIVNIGLDLMWPSARFHSRLSLVMNDSFEERLADVQRRIAAACRRAGRNPESVRIVTVSKTHGPERVHEAAAAGLTVFGESRVQEARQKIPLCPAALTWHLIGHLQTNKVKDAVNLFHSIQAVDSLKLLMAIETAAEAAGRIMPVFLEVNVSGESSKFGLAPEAVPGVLKVANGLRRVEIQGLLTIPPLAEDPEHARPFFQALREHRDRWRQETGFELRELSMGMSHDFEIAVEEGATWIRLGTILFGKRNTP